MTQLDSLFVSFQLALAGRYSIDSELGRGGMGIVYLAREVHLDRLVAIKLLPPSRASEPGLREHFLREARLAAKLSHPNIIPIHAVEETQGFVYYVMAFIDGETLAHRVRTRGPLPASDCARVLREAAWALAYAHGQGLVHRDVKPDNILIEKATGRVLVADFGIAASYNEAGPERIAGTPEFMSPEQALGKSLDARSDLYALGATAFYAFSGRFPFEGASATEVLAKQVTEPAPALASLGLTVPRKLAALVDRCLAKNPDHRPASAQVFAEQLGVAIEQRRELPAALRAFVKRNGRLDGGGTLIVGLNVLPLSIGIAAWLGAPIGFTVLLATSTALPFAYLTSAARRLMLLGFDHPDLRPAFAADLEQTREELAVEHQRGPTRLERVLRLIARTSGVIWAGSIVPLIWMTLTRNPLASSLAFASGVSGFVMCTSGIVMLASVQRRRDVDTEFWSRIWLGRIGKLAFAVAKKLIGARRVGPAMTHRATELSLGMAAEQLFESLPKESRAALGDLPPLLARLQIDAQSLRKRHDALNEAISEAGDLGSSEHVELVEMRNSVGARLSEAVGALETIRLNLLRLHAGSATVQSLTTHLDLAAEVSREVERLIAGHAEAEMIMKFPRERAATPA